MRYKLTGWTFGRWTVLGLDGEYLTSKTRRLMCRCRCGNEKSVREEGLKRGSSTSCGCYRREAASARRTDHGMSQTPTYRSWSQMIRRCHNPIHHQYANYGARGVEVCPRWRKSFRNFLKDMGERLPGTTIDRINGRKGYFPKNCRWATPLEQSNNARTNVVVEYQGQKRTIAEWAAHAGMNYYTFWSRLRHGWDFETALTRPIRPRTKV